LVNTGRRPRCELLLTRLLQLERESFKTERENHRLRGRPGNSRNHPGRAVCRAIPGIECSIFRRHNGFHPGRTAYKEIFQPSCHCIAFWKRRKERQFTLCASERQNVPGIFQLGLDEHFSIRLISLSRADSTLIERRSPRATRLTYDGSMPNWRATRL
jgi:hypothetical protein